MSLFRRSNKIELQKMNRDLVVNLGHAMEVACYSFLSFDFECCGYFLSTSSFRHATALSLSSTRWLTENYRAGQAEEKLKLLVVLIPVIS